MDICPQEWREKTLGLKDPAKDAEKRSLKRSSTAIRISSNAMNGASGLKRPRRLKMKQYIGIDPGKKGGLAVIAEEGYVTVIPLDYRILHEQLRALSLEDCVCCLEKVHAMPGQGVTSMFTFGEGYGFTRGMLEAFNIPYQEIQPQKWKREFGLTGDKADSIAVAHRLFPNVNLKASDRCRTDHDGMAEALLMAEYARRKL